MSIIEKAVEQLAKKAVEELSSEADRKADSASASVTTRDIKKESIVALDSVDVTGGIAHHKRKGAANYVELNLDRLATEGFLVPGSSSTSSLAQELQLIKRRLLSNAHDLKTQDVPDGNIVLITSAMPKEGKSFISLNLAFSMAAELNKMPLLIDVDVAKNDVSNVLGLNPQLGLIDILDQETDISAALFDSNIPNLKILPAGARLSNTPELLASDRMVSFLDELANEYSDHMIILDGPPLLATSEASVLARMVGQVIVVVEAGRTRETQLEEALSRLDPNKIISLILNKSRERQKKGDYGYYYSN